MQYLKAEIDEILEQHRKWLYDESGGKMADLHGADLREADLRGADLRKADLRGADLRKAEALTVITPEGAFIGWKRCRNGVLVKLRVPEDARRSNATGRKCRAEFVDVLEVLGSDEGISTHDEHTVYRIGERVACDTWCEDRWKECAGGIHFFLTRWEAENYN